MKQKIKKIGRWLEYNYKIENTIVNKYTIEKALSNLYREKLLRLKKQQLIKIIFKLKIKNSFYRSISYLQIVKKEDFNKLADIFNEYWIDKTDEYHQYGWTEIVFSYKILGLDSENKETKLISYLDNKKNKSQTYKFSGFNLPKTMDYTEWGEIVQESIKFDHLFVIVSKPYSNSDFWIHVYENKLEVEIYARNYIKTPRLSFTDYLNDKENLATFTRIIKNQKYIFIDGDLKLKQIKRESRFLKSIIKDIQNNKNKYITMDLETRTIDKEMKPFCISTFDGKIAISYYLSDYKNSEVLMIEAALKSIMKSKYDGYKIYFHNFSYFDGIFLIKHLSNLSKLNLKPIVKDGRFINFPFKFRSEKGGKIYTIYFRDSYLLLPSSLRKLALSFYTELKGIYPYKFVDNNNLSLIYEGKVPAIKYFSKISEDEYNKYCSLFKNQKWNLKKETIKYCEQDCIVLYHIIDNFGKRIYNHFKIDIQKYPTLPSLSFAIYRSNFLKDYKIPLVDGEMYSQIKKGYTGGAVDVYKPYGKEVYRYDVNSLYPYVMKEFAMPVGHGIYFEGDISLVENKPFGIFEVEVAAPENLKVPILQLRFKIKEGLRTLAPLGKWTSWYLSEELYNSENYGYTYKIKRGYIFEKEKIFTEFVDYLYNLKVNSDRNSPDYIIAKLLMNSLYGRLGMNPELEKHIIITEEEEDKFTNKENIVVTNIISFDNGKELISFFDSDLPEENNRLVNVSIPISTAVTAYARIYMSSFKMNFLKLGIKLFYSDTDSFDIDLALDSKFVGKELGKVKLEHIFDESIYLAPKVYGAKIKGLELLKVKGLKSPYTFEELKELKIKGIKNPVSFKQLKTLLKKGNKLELKHDKWYQDITKGKITIEKEIYTLMVTDNKRKLLFNKNNNKFFDTIPLKINEDNIEE